MLMSVRLPIQSWEIRMPIKLMFITNNLRIASFAEQAGVDRIFVDLETLGKAERQAGMDTVQSVHSIYDVIRMRKILKKSELFVRVNQINDASVDEINSVVEAGADVIMLPYFKNPDQVITFLQTVNGRTKTCLLFETPESVLCVDEILSLAGIDECYVGLNDLHLGYKKKFMFELVADGTVDRLCQKFAAVGKTYGFGGIARIGTGLLPADIILGEHIRLESSIVILSRGFCDIRSLKEEECKRIFLEQIPKFRDREYELRCCDESFFQNNHEKLKDIVSNIVESMS